MSFMITQEQIMNALKHVEDPELHKSIVELNMVRNIQMNGTEVKLEVVLTIQGCPLKAKIQQDVEESLQAIGASKVDLIFWFYDTRRTSCANREVKEK